MHVVNVHVVGAQAAQARFKGATQMVARSAAVVGTGAGGKERLGGDQRLVALAPKCFAENLFGAAIRVAVRCVEQVHACFKADIDQFGRFCDVGASPGFEKLIGAAECAGAKT